jgi:hypothetical protein
VDYLVGTIILLASLLVEYLEIGRAVFPYPAFPKTRAFTKTQLNTILRFWRTVRWIELLGMFILFATLLVFFVVPLFQKRPPSHTTLNFFRGTIAPLSFVYVVHENWELLRRIWKHDLGKVAYGLFVPLTLTASTVWADQQIRSLTQSNPSLFPSAQKAITALNFICLAFAIIVIAASLYMAAMYLMTFFRVIGWPNILSRRPLILPSLYWMAELAAYTWALLFIVEISSFLDTSFAGAFLKADLAEFGVKPINLNLTELFLIRSSFIENYSTDGDLVCKNLSPNARVSPFNTREPIPNEVLLAQPISAGPDRFGRSFTYRVVECSKPTDPDRVP